MIIHKPWFFLQYPRDRWSGRDENNSWSKIRANDLTDLLLDTWSSDALRRWLWILLFQDSPYLSVQFEETGMTSFQKVRQHMHETRTYPSFVCPCSRISGLHSVALSGRIHRCALIENMSARPPWALNRVYPSLFSQALQTPWRPCDVLHGNKTCNT